jgi:hypothetical protein
MQPRNRSSVPTHRAVIDSATLFLCRQGPRWVVVIESPGFNGAMAFEHRGRDSHDARFDLLRRAREACPDAAIMSSDGALTSEDYEWRVEVRGVEGRPGNLGRALRHVLSTKDASEGAAPRPLLGRRCHWGMSTSASGRPRTF